MLPRRAVQGSDESLEQTSQMTAMESARSAAESSADKGEAKKSEEHVSLFWRLFGGTILSIAALVAINIFNNMSSSIAELRAEVAREREARGDMVKKDEFNTRITSQYERIRGIDALKVELEGLKERGNTNANAIESLKKDATTAADAVKRDTASLEVLKERLAGLEAIKKDVAGIDSLKEKAAAAAADLKVLRDMVQKVSNDIEGNKTYDLERKAFRDAQYKQFEDTIKEIQKGLQDCREKLARLEGAKPTTETPVVRPAPAKPTGSGKSSPEPGIPDDMK